MGKKKEKALDDILKGFKNKKDIPTIKEQIMELFTKKYDDDEPVEENKIVVVGRSMNMKRVP